MAWFVWWLLALSALAFLACVIDKSRARSGASRIPERVLLGLALVGGSPGLLLGMILVRHKTRKAAFLVPFVAILLLQGAGAWFITRG